MRFLLQLGKPKLVQILRVTIFAMLFAGLNAPANAVAQDAVAEGDAMEEGETKEEEKQPFLLDLGSFKIHDLRPTRNVTAKLTFSVHLGFSKELSDTQRETLEMWKHRLRDQIITAVRISTIKEFQEADLDRLSRKILIRVNRLFNRKIAEQVLVSEYLFRTN